MNIIKLKLQNFEIIPLEKQYVVENQVNEFVLEFDDTWEYDTKYVIFDNEETTYKRPVINNQVIVPSELLNGRTTIQVYGQNVENGEIVKRKPSYKYSFTILNSLSTEGQEETDLPTPSQWEVYISQIEEMCNDLQDQFNDLKEECESKCDDVIERLAQDEQDIQTNTDNIRANAEAIDKLNTDLLDYSLITETGNKISMSISSTTYVITLSLKDKNDNVLSTQSIDLPLETMIVGASYSNGVLTFTLKNGQTLQVPISDLISGLVSTDTFNQAVQGLSNRITTIENDYLKSTDKTELQEQITANADDIDDIQEEQLTQNADIEELQQENERLSRIVEGLPTKQANGTTFVLNDMVKANIKDYQLKGNTIQDGTPTTDSPIAIQTVTGNQEINVYGKNLYNLDLASGSIGSNGQNISDSKSLRTTGYSFIQNKDYSLSFESNSTISEAWLNYYNDDTFIRRVYLGSGNSKTFTTPTDANIVRFRFTSANDLTTSSITKIQLELGNTPTTYENYITPITKTISLGNIELCKIGDYQDRIYKQGNKWYIEKKIGKYIIDENTPIESSGVSSGFNTMRVLMTNILSSNKAISSSGNVKSNYFVGNVMWNRDEEGIYVDQNNVVYRINTSTIGGNTRENLTNWLSTHNIILYYILATPTTTEITDTSLITQLEDILNIILNENNTIIVNGNLPSDTLVIGYADIAKLIASLSSQDNRSVEENTRKVEEPIEEKGEER